METTFLDHTEPNANTVPEAYWAAIPCVTTYRYQFAEKFEGGDEFLPELLYVTMHSVRNLDGERLYHVVLEDGYDNAYYEAKYMTWDELFNTYGIKIPRI